MAKTVGENIREYRKQLNISQLELANKVGVKRPTVGSWERNRTEPSIVDIQNLCDVFGCRVEDITGIKQKLDNAKHPILLSDQEYRLIMELREHRELNEEQLTKMFNKIIKHKVDNNTISNPIDTNETLHYEIRVKQFLRD